MTLATFELLSGADVVATALPLLWPDGAPAGGFETGLWPEFGVGVGAGFGVGVGAGAG